MNEENYPKEEFFLSRWLNNDLSEKELEQFKKTKDFELYEHVLNGISKLGTPDYEESQAYLDFTVKRESRSNQIVGRSKTKIIFAVAASISILITVMFFGGRKTLSTDIGQKNSLELPDGSLITLNAKSSVTYNKWLFTLYRNLEIQGTAFFEVNPGSVFTVKTINGSVEVVGTEFSVTSRDNIFETYCYEGKVKVQSNTTSEFLTQGQVIKFLDQKQMELSGNHSEHRPSWIVGVSKFENTPLKLVVMELEAQFGISFDYEGVSNFSKKLYSGAFEHNHKDVASALENVFLPLGIQYSFENKDSVVILKDMDIVE